MYARTCETRRPTAACPGTARVCAPVVFAAAMLLSSAAWSQSAPPPAPPSAPPPAADPGSPRTVPEQIAPPDGNGAGNGIPSPSVITPAPTDPGIQAPVRTPTHDPMVVIPPPGTPGGDPNVIPK